jgi:hypothetical protein
MKRLRQYFKLFSQSSDKVLFDDNVSAMLQAQGFYVEEAPRSIYSVEKLHEALHKYAPQKKPASIPFEIIKPGIDLAYACFARPHDVRTLGVLPLTLDVVKYLTSNPSGSPGLTNYGSTKSESQVHALGRGLQILSRERAPEPCLAFKRTQFGGKTRLVWGYPYSMTVLEGLVARPLIDKFKGAKSPMAFAMSTMALGAKLRVSSYRKRWAYSIDIKSFDSSVSAQLIREAFRVIKTWFDLAEIEPTSGKTVRELFNIIEHYFIHTTIVMPDGNIYKGKRHGVPSGSYFTQFVDSVVNTILCGALAARFHLHVDKRDLFVLGDDLLFFSNVKVNLSEISQWISSVFGLTMSEEKSRVTRYDETVHFLGREWSNGMPNMAVDEILKRLVYPEKFRFYEDDPSGRARQVRMLILAFASQAVNGWSIAYKTLDGSDRHIHRGSANLDANTYRSGGRPKQLDPEMLTGLMRYRQKYLFRDTRYGIPDTALQYWL